MGELTLFVVRVDGELTDDVRDAFKAGMSDRTGWVGIVPEWGDWANAWTTQQDAAGTAHFRVSVSAETPEQARERVESLFADLEGVSVRTVDRRAGEPVYGRYEEITYRAVEHLVVELMTGYAAEAPFQFRGAGPS